MAIELSRRTPDGKHSAEQSTPTDGKRQPSTTFSVEANELSADNFANLMTEPHGTSARVFHAQRQRPFLTSERSNQPVDAVADYLSRAKLTAQQGEHR